ncbi:MAG: nucleotidyltransferase domain-containing protein [Nanoarchaeota archaeon]
MFIEIRTKGKNKKYYAVHSVRKGNRVIKLRKYLGQNLSKKELTAQRKDAQYLVPLKQPTKIPPKLLRSLKELKRKYKAERIILFGSRARGDHHEGSDVDLILIKKTNQRFTDRIEHVLRIYPGKEPLEPLVYTPEEWKEMLGRDFIQGILEEGVEIG